MRCRSHLRDTAISELKRRLNGTESGVRLDDFCGVAVSRRVVAGRCSELTGQFRRLNGLGWLDAAHLRPRR